MMMKFLALLLIAVLKATSANHNTDGTGGFVTLVLNAPSTTNYYSVCGDYTYFKVNMPDPCSDLNLQVVPSSGEPDIYVSKANLDQDPYPTKNKLTWAAYADGDYNLTISHWDPESSPGWYYIGIYDDCSKQSQTARYSIRAYTSEDNADDIYVNKKLSINKLIAASDYTYHRFCVPSCADVKVTLQNCLSYEECGKSYSFPELLVTRTNQVPTIYSYSYKLAQIERRFVLVNHTDPSGRDHNGFMTGSYYVGVYGWCTPDAFVNNYTTDGPCSYAANTHYNVTVELTYLPASSCDASHLQYSAPSSTVTKIKSGQVIRGVVPVNEYVYYSIDVTDPCETLNIWTGDSSNPNYTVPELAVGKWPNLKPTFDNLEWSSYSWTAQNLSISAWDADFDGGYVCGPFKNSTCTYIIGVLGYASLPNITTVDFTLIATLTPQHKIFDNPQLNQRISPHGMNQYAFCVRSEEDVSAELVSWSSQLASQCPSSYSSLEMVISRTNPLATTTDLVWRLGHGETKTNAIYLFHNDADTRLGSYYLNVLGYCTTCTNPATCAPCSNLNKTRYAVVVSNNVLFNVTADRQKYLGSCPVTSSSTTTTSTSGGSSSGSRNSLSDGAKVGIAIAVLVVCIAIGMIIYRAFRKEQYSNPNATLIKAANDDSDHDMVEAANPVSV